VNHDHFISSVELLMTYERSQTALESRPTLHDGETPSGETWLARARSLRPIIEEYRAEAERERRLPMPVYEAMRDAGIFRMWVPKALGGYGLGEADLLPVVEEVARYDGSAAWNLAIGVESGAIWAFLPGETAARMRAENPVGTAAASVNPSRAKATRVAGGYRVSGRWSFASGCHQATWFLGAAIVENDANDGGPPVPRLFVMPMRECSIIDTWHVTGLRGTGSADVVAEDVFVPEDCTFLVHGPEATKSYQPEAHFRAPLARVLGLVLAGVGLGIARDAIDSFRDTVSNKTPFGGQSKVLDLHTTHLRIGQAEAILRSGRELLYSVAREVDEALETKGEVDDDLFASAMIARPHAGASAVQAVDLVLACAGTTGVFEGNRLEQCARDVRVVPQHVYLSHTNLEMAGQYLLGGPLQLRR
jgi:alkylation response protein AidB-like acyl-CoA dehydrogenase